MKLSRQFWVRNGLSCHISAAPITRASGGSSSNFTIHRSTGPHLPFTTTQHNLAERHSDRHPLRSYCQRPQRALFRLRFDSLCKTSLYSVTFHKKSNCAGGDGRAQPKRAKQFLCCLLQVKPSKTIRLAAGHLAARPTALLLIFHCQVRGHILHGSQAEVHRLSPGERGCIAQASSGRILHMRGDAPRRQKCAASG